MRDYHKQCGAPAELLEMVADSWDGGCAVEQQQQGQRSSAAPGDSRGIRRATRTCAIDYTWETSFQLMKHMLFWNMMINLHECCAQ